MIAKRNSKQINATNDVLIILLTNFMKNLKIFQVQLNILPKLRLLFCFHQKKIQKISHFWHFKDHNFGSKHDNYINDPIFFTYFLRSFSWYNLFLHFKTFEIQFHEAPLCIILWSAKYTLTYQRWHLLT